ncbi:phage portal protein [Lactococcus lactis]|uniref:phage portal protein n=1 Tax=Lactococcus lactis TaxID=1358 RepID=UPI0022DEC32E|nr:phage portal protein [Lactococcus lactis]MDA2886041.1 phage portal protein [Lactococcus lactis]MDA2888574.1 phage portal protein [Lactococcus lactis]MDA2908523.1 phage portal protein [Lactococcus lactis]
MGLFSDIWASVKSKSENTDVSGYTALFNAQATLGMKNAALESCVSYLARLISKGKFVFKNESSITDSDFNYALNVKPNPNQTASEFKVAMVKKLLNGELLVIRDNDKFYVADSFVTNYSLDGNTYSGVTINFSSSNVANAPNSGPYAQKYFDRSFTQGVDCFHLDNDNIGIKKYIDSLWEDYGKLFGILITNQLRVGQLRAKLSIPVNTKLEEDEQKKVQKQFATTLSQSLLTDPIVFVPDNGKAQSAYDEISSSKSATLQNQIMDFGTLKKIFIGEIAGLIGIPPALVLGETANNSENLDLAIESAAIPLGNKLSEGFASLLIKESGFMNGNTLQMTGFKTINILDRADAIDKVGSSGVVKINEVREASNLPPIPDGDRFIMTKNYEEKGKEKDE